jgi:outer membrane lipoprotein SlyB
MRGLTYFSTLVVLMFFLVANALAQDVVIYPANGQDQEQMEKDKFECYTWAKQQTGFDPMQTPQATAPPPQQEAKQGGAVRGAVRGAAVGTVVGGIAGGEWGKGAAAGAAGGALLGGMRRQDQRRQQQQAQKQWEEQQVAEYTQKRNAYDRAYAACLEGKGYTVK